MLFLFDLGSIITREDLNNYRPVWGEPIKMELHNGEYTSYVIKPPSAGLVYQFIMKILDGKYYHNFKFIFNLEL